MNERATIHESLLLQQLAAGSEEAFAQLYKSHQPVVLAFALRLLKTKTLAEEVCNDVFTAFWQNRAQATGLQCLRSYLLTAVRNRSINALKALARQQASVTELHGVLSPQFLSAEEHLLQKEYVDFIRRQVAALPPRAKEVFGLCRDEGCSYDEVSARLGISRNAVKGHMVYSMKKLKAVAEKDLGISFALAFFFLL